jgi:trehalose 6-phosphate synthase/phosphatase
VQGLARAPAQLAAVVSGRPKAELERFFGRTAGLWLAAEHGAILRGPGREWETLRPSLPREWKQRVHPVLEHFVLRTPGSFVEEKEYSLVWHYRMADPEFGEWLSHELLATLEELLAETELRAVPGKKSVEVRLTWATKAEVARRLEAEMGPFDFRLALGDDRTDEDLFAAMPADAYTVHVGDGPSRARFRLPTPEAARLLLQKLAPLPRTHDEA